MNKEILACTCLFPAWYFDTSCVKVHTHTVHLSNFWCASSYLDPTGQNVLIKCFPAPIKISSEACELCDILVIISFWASICCNWLEWIHMDRVEQHSAFTMRFSVWCLYLNNILYLMSKSQVIHRRKIWLIIRVSEVRVNLLISRDEYWYSRSSVRFRAICTATKKNRYRNVILTVSTETVRVKLSN